MRKAANTDVQDSSNHQKTLSTTSKVKSKDPYQNERWRMLIARRWDDVHRIFGWGGVLFNSWMPAKWFHVKKVSQRDWSDIVKELPLVRDKFGEVLREKTPELASILLSTTITGYLVHVAVLTC
jgi:hypothetical protein